LGSALEWVEEKACGAETCAAVNFYCHSHF
jgi:hypothetical protein